MLFARAPVLGLYFFVSVNQPGPLGFGFALAVRERVQMRARSFLCFCFLAVGRSGPNMEPGRVRDYVMNGSRNGLNSRMVGSSIRAHMVDV